MSTDRIAAAIASLAEKAERECLERTIRFRLYRAMIRAFRQGVGFR